MSFISGRNFLAPFANKTHLFSIIVLSVLFAVYRLTGGYVQVAPSDTGGDVRREAPRETHQAPVTQTAPRAGAESRRIAPPVSEDDVLKELLRAEKPRDERPTPKVPAKDRLEDIKRQLGL